MAPLPLRYLDIVLVIVAIPVMLALGAPSLGTAVGAGAWIVQRVLHAATKRWTSRQATPRMALGVNLFEAFGRIWLLGGAIVAAGVIGGRADGLTAALLIFGAYSVAFVIRVFSGPPSGPAGPPKAGRPAGPPKAGAPNAGAPRRGASR